MNLNPLNVLQDAVTQAATSLNSATSTTQATTSLNPLNVLQDTVTQAATSLNSATSTTQATTSLNPLNVLQDTVTQAATSLNSATSTTQATTSLNPLNVLQDTVTAAATSLNPLNVIQTAAESTAAAATSLNPLNVLEDIGKSATTSLNPTNIIQDMIKEAIETAVKDTLSKLIPASMLTILEHPLSLSSYTPLFKKLRDWVGHDPLRLLFVVMMGKLALVVLVAVLAFMLFFFMATASAVFIIMAGVLIVSGSTASMTISVITVSGWIGVLWVVAKKMVAQVCKAETALSANVADIKTQLSKSAASSSTNQTS